ncbi:MAG: hypothetical protein AAFV33_00305 [Chloroflexota bacterium]
MLAVIFVIAIPFIWGQLFLPQYFGDSLELEGGAGGALLFTGMFGGYAYLCFFIFYRGWQQRRAVIRELQNLGATTG